MLGESQRAAQINIVRRGLDVGSIAQMRLLDAPEDQVLGQSPPPNASGIAAPKISLLLALPPQPQALVMPSFVGQPLGTVTLALQDDGLRLGTVTAVTSPENTTPTTAPPASAPSPASMVVSQTPNPGEKVMVGAAVNFEVR